MRVLESNGTEHTFFDGAATNNFTAGGKSGRVYGLTMSKTTQHVVLSAGMLLIRGYRIVFEGENIFTLSTFPAGVSTEKLILRLTVSSSSASVTFFLGDEEEKDNIEQGPGVYDYHIATLVMNSNGIQEITSHITDISAGGPGGTVIIGDSSGGGILDLAIPNMSEPQLAGLLTTLSSGIYKIHTSLYGIELLYLDSANNYATRYTNRGNVYKYDYTHSTWVLASGIPEINPGTVWHYGNVITQAGTYNNAYLNANANVNDFFINTNDGCVYRCTANTGSTTTWAYVFRMKDNVVATTNTTAQAINLVVAEGKEYSYNYPAGVSGVSITIPEHIYHGFYAGLNWRNGATPPDVSIVNNSNYEVKLVYKNAQVLYYSPTPDTITNTIIYCDGINVYLYIGEVEA
jgi:hypothetical protein